MLGIALELAEHKSLVYEDIARSDSPWHAIKFTIFLLFAHSDCTRWNAPSKINYEVPNSLFYKIHGAYHKILFVTIPSWPCIILGHLLYHLVFTKFFTLLLPLVIMYIFYCVFYSYFGRIPSYAAHTNCILFITANSLSTLFRSQVLWIHLMAPAYGMSQMAFIMTIWGFQLERLKYWKVIIVLV